MIKIFIIPYIYKYMYIYIYIYTDILAVAGLTRTPFKSSPFKNFKNNNVLFVRTHHSEGIKDCR